MAGAEATTTPPLTPQLIEKLEEGEYSDSSTPGLFLRVNKKSRTFRWYVRSIGRIVTIGRWSKTPKPGHVTLAEARVWLDKLRDAHRSGTLDQVVKELEALHPRRRVEKSGPEALLVENLAKEFLAFYLPTIRKPESVQRHFDNEILPVLGKKSYPDVKTEDISALIRGVSGRGATVFAGHVYVLTRQFFSWVEDTKSGLRAPRFPAVGNLGATKSKERQRVLSLEEVGHFWNACEVSTRFTTTVRDALHLLLLLGVRSGELRMAELTEFDLENRVWTIPPEHQKRHRLDDPAKPWRVPLHDKSIEILEGLIFMAKQLRSNYLLASPANKGKPLTEKALNHAMRRLFTGDDPPLKFPAPRPVPHDLRRTLRHHARETLKVPFDVAEKLMAHSLGRIARTYDPGDLFDEREPALRKWERTVLRSAGRLPSPTSAWLYAANRRKAGQGRRKRQAGEKWQ